MSGNPITVVELRVLILTQAVNSCKTGMSYTAEDIVDIAKTFEQYITNGAVVTTKS